MKDVGMTEGSDLFKNHLHEITLDLTHQMLDRHHKDR